MRSAQRALDGVARCRCEDISTRRFQVEEEDLVEDKVFRIDEVFGEEGLEGGVYAVDDLGVCGVLFREGGFVLAQFDFLGDDGGAEGFVADVEFATEGVGAIDAGGHGLEVEDRYG